MKGRIFLPAVIILAILTIGSLSACSTSTSDVPIQSTSTQDTPTTAPSVGTSEDDLEDETEILNVDDSGVSSVDEAALVTAIAPFPASELTEEEIAGLLYLREEEKLAHDVYTMLYTQWSLPIFQNIASSEATHTEAVKTLLDRYQLDDPVGENGIGVFFDPTLQSLYDQLIAQGSQSLVEALKVGASIEEIDILDLEQQIAQTDTTDIILVYENLMKGSRNHLRSFVSTIEQQGGGTYQPQYLDPAVYEEIIGASIERGGNVGRQ